MNTKLFRSTFVLLALLAPAAFAAECPVREIGVDATATASLASSDCRYRDIVPGTTRSVFVHQYQVTVATRGVLTIEQNSTEVDPILSIYSDGYELLASNDNISATDKNSLVTISLAPGKYIFFASAAATGQTGNYTVKTSFQLSPSCPVEELTFGVGVSSELTNNDCRILDIETPSADTSRVKQYSFKAPERGVFTIEMLSPAFVTFLDLLDSKRNELTYAVPDQGNDSRLLVSLKPDTYILYASTDDFGIGAFTISTTMAPLRTCEAKEIGLSATLSGNLAEGTCRYMDVEVPSADDTLLDKYTLNVTDPVLLTLDMKSKEVDAYLLLLDSKGNYIGGDDDSGGGTDSRISVSLGPGSYTIYANTAEYGTGTYTLATATEPLRSCGGMDLLPGITATGTIQTTGCRYLDVVTPSSNRTLVDRYNVTLDQRSVLNVETTSQNFPAAVTILDSNLVVVNGTSTSTTSLSFGMLLNAGKYTILVSPAGAYTGAFTLKTTVQDPPNCPTESIAPNATATGQFATGDCRVKDVIAGLLETNLAKVYELKLEEPGTLTMSISSPDSFVAALLLTTNDTLIDSTAGDTTTEHVTQVLAAGTYKIVLAPISTTLGSYTLTTEFAATPKPAAPTSSVAR